MHNNINKNNSTDPLSWDINFLKIASLNVAINLINILGDYRIKLETYKANIPTSSSELTEAQTATVSEKEHLNALSKAIAEIGHGMLQIDKYLTMETDKLTQEHASSQNQNNATIKEPANKQSKKQTAWKCGKSPVVIKANPKNTEKDSKVIESNKKPKQIKTDITLTNSSLSFLQNLVKLNQANLRYLDCESTVLKMLHLSSEQRYKENDTMLGCDRKLKLLLSLEIDTLINLTSYAQKKIIRTIGYSTIYQQNKQEINALHATAEKIKTLAPISLFLLNRIKSRNIFTESIIALSILITLPLAPIMWLRYIFKRKQKSKECAQEMEICRDLVLRTWNEAKIDLQKIDKISQIFKPILNFTLFANNKSQAGGVLAPRSHISGTNFIQK